jgi:uncharacterized protein YoxC
MFFTPSRSHIHSLVTGKTEWTRLQEQMDSLSATIDDLTHQFDVQTTESAKISKQFQSDISDASERLRHLQAQLTTSVEQTSGSIPTVETVGKSLLSLQKQVSPYFFSFLTLSTLL